MRDTGSLGLVHWDDPEGWYGKAGGRKKEGSQKAAQETILLPPTRFLGQAGGMLGAEGVLGCPVYKSPHGSQHALRLTWERKEPDPDLICYAS